MQADRSGARGPGTTQVRMGPGPTNYFIGIPIRDRGSGADIDPAYVFEGVYGSKSGYALHF